MKGLTLTTKEQTRLSIMNGVLERQWAVGEAAQLLGVSERHAWRVLAAYRKEGAAALAHGNRNRLPSNTVSPEIKAQVIALAGERYQGFNHTHFTELLAEREGIALSRSTVRRLLVGTGVASPRHRRPPRHRYRRERMPQEGMLVQIDGSHHRWFGESGPWLTLLLAVDDATGTVPYALFREQEDTEGYFRLMIGIIERRGIPLALYSDRYFVFCYSKRGETGEMSVIDRGKPTQFGRAMGELGVTQVFARSPEAKGRIERANGTFQDRLVSELRLAGASTIDEANGILETFLPRFNERFGVSASQPEPAYRTVDPGLDIDSVLCFKEVRRVAKDNTVQYHRKILQIFAGPERTSYARAHVEVQERLDGQLVVCYRGKILSPGKAPPLASELRVQAEELSQHGLPVITSYQEPEELESKRETLKAQPGKIWWEDSDLRRLHRELVKAGMQRARESGKRIGRPRVFERPQFAERFEAVMDSLTLGVLSRHKAAKELSIGYATLKRLLDSRSQSPVSTESLPPIEKVYAEVLH
jgi:transposase